MNGADPSVAMRIDESRALERSGDMGAALGQAQKALEQAQASGEGEHIAAALAQLAHIKNFRLGNYDRARELAQEALTWAAPDAPARCRAWLTLGNCAAEGHSLDEAEIFYHQTADLARRIGNHAHRARALHNLANGVYFPRGLFDLALSLEDECAQLVRRHGLENLLRFPLFTTARICQLTGQRERARAGAGRTGRHPGARRLLLGYHAVVSALLTLDEGDDHGPGPAPPRPGHRREGGRAGAERPRPPTSCCLLLPRRQCPCGPDVGRRRGEPGPARRLPAPAGAGA
ncbi:MAG: tetratricopeptide repeat protein, partial [Anaerolineae bacterium]|nr:tetratricopeptide repeat protein [Anaerolineae bacterium]